MNPIRRAIDNALDIATVEVALRPAIEEKIRSRLQPNGNGGVIVMSNNDAATHFDDESGELIPWTIADLVIDIRRASPELFAPSTTSQAKPAAPASRPLSVTEIMLQEKARRAANPEPKAAPPSAQEIAASLERRRREPWR